MTKLTEKDIERYAGLAGIRKKLSVYIGPPDSNGLWTIWREPGDNTVDRALAGQNSLTHLIIDKDPNTYWCLDAGDGIPVGKKEFIDEHGRKEILSTLYVATGLTHGGSNFKGSTISRGTHGIGQKATNAASEYFKVWTYRDSQWYAIEYNKGKLTKDVHKSQAPKLPHGIKAKCGTVTCFKPDLTLFTKSAKMPIKDALSWCQITSLLVPKLKVMFTDEKGKTTTFITKKGPIDYLDTRKEELKCEYDGKPFVHQTQLLDVVLGFSDASGDDLIQCYTNGLKNADGGLHKDALEKALYDSLKVFAGKKQKFKKEDVQEGLVGLVNAKLAAPMFDNQRKDVLIDERVYEPAYDEIKKALDNFFKVNKALAKRLCTKACELRTLTEGFKASKKLVSKVKAASKKQSAKLSDIIGNAPLEKREIFLCEGDSAAGGLKQTRDKSFQAVFPLKGKPLNVLKATQDKINNNQEIVGVLAALGIDLSKNEIKPRYGKIIILADADDDGCVSGNTRILTLDGKNPTIEQLAKRWDKNGKHIWIYSRKKDGTLVPAKAIKPRKTVVRRKATRVTLNDGTTYLVTRDHEFMINTSKGWKYKQASQLKVGQSLNSVYLSETSSDGTLTGKGYHSIEGVSLNPNKKVSRTPVHRWVMYYTNRKKYNKWKELNHKSGMGGAAHFHHYNEDKTDNRPTNLKLLKKRKHGKLHMSAYAADYNGSEKHLEDLARFNKSKRGIQRRKKASKILTAYNRSQQHRDTVRDMNSDSNIVYLQKLGKYSRYYVGLEKKGYEINAQNWNKYLRKGVCRWENLPVSIEKLEQFVTRRNYRVKKSYTIKIQPKASYPEQFASKFIAMCVKVYNKYGKVNEKLYTRMRKDEARGTPKWSTAMERLNWSEEKIVSKAKKKLNHTVVEVKNVILKEPKQFYCMTVPKYGNFMLADDNGNGVGSSNSHITCLLLAFFWKFTPQLFKRGNIYISVSPRYRCVVKNNTYFGQSKRKLREKYGPKAAITYLKGLGELQPEQLYHVACNPESRKLIKLDYPKNRQEIKNFEAMMGKDGQYNKQLLGISRENFNG